MSEPNLKKQKTSKTISKTSSKTISTSSKTISTVMINKKNEKSFIKKLFFKQFNPNNLSKKEIEKLVELISVENESVDYYQNCFLIKHQNEKLTLEEIVCQLELPSEKLSVKIDDKYHFKFLFNKEEEKYIYVTKIFIKSDIPIDYKKSDSFFNGKLIPVKQIDCSSEKLEFLVQTEVPEEKESSIVFTANEITREFLDYNNYCTIPSFHFYGYILFFKPVISDIRKLIPSNEEIPKIYFNTSLASYGPSAHTDYEHIALTRIFF